MNHLYEYGLHKTRTARINGSRLSSRPDRSNDDVVYYEASKGISLDLKLNSENLPLPRSRRDLAAQLSLVRYILAGFAFLQRHSIRFFFK